MLLIIFKKDFLRKGCWISVFKTFNSSVFLLLSIIIIKISCQKVFWGDRLSLEPSPPFSNGAPMALVTCSNFGVVMFSLNTMEEQRSTVAEILNGLLAGAIMVIHLKKKAIVVCKQSYMTRDFVHQY